MKNLEELKAPYGEDDPVYNGSYRFHSRDHGTARLGRRQSGVGIAGLERA